VPDFPIVALEELDRVGVIDVGSNSVRLVVFDGAARSPAYFYNEKVLCGLGKGLAETGLLHAEGRERALLALRRFSALSDGMALHSLTAVATAAVREARDGPAFCAQVLAQTGLALDVASGVQEARLSAQGVLLGWPDACGLVCDIGGASMELAEVASGEVGVCETSSLGTLRLNEVAGGPQFLQNHIARAIAAMQSRFAPHYDQLFLVGGSFRAIARLDMERQKYPLKVLHEYRMSPETLSQTLNWLEGQDPEALSQLGDTSTERLAQVPMAALVLRGLISAFSPKHIAVSSYGIREGMLYQRMPDELRRRDPLIEACLAMEATSARFPGFGQVLADWLAPLYAGATPAQLRLVRAACLLHDVTWRAHPDYRAEVCFDNATRANLGGLDHQGRVFLGMALLHRYKNGRPSHQFYGMTEILSEEMHKQAETLGKAMRLGALLGGATTRAMGRLHLCGDVLELALDPDNSNIFGEVVSRRLASLARVLDREPRVLMG
jgi:exopolyphosphatase / guanosine-5'-triphosphate,3'-diphosphate pyrophosphatase